MSRSAEISLDWADGHHTFALKWGQLAELQEKTDAGPYYVLGRLFDGTWRIEDIREPIRLGLIGGGMPPAQAMSLVRRYVEDRPPLENLTLAQAVMQASVVGAPEEEVGKSAAGRKRAPRSRVAKSGSPASMEPARPSD